MMLCRLVSGLLIALAMAGAARGQGAAPAGKVVFPGENVQARNRLQSADHLLELGNKVERQQLRSHTI